MRPPRVQRWLHRRGYHLTRYAYTVRALRQQIITERGVTDVVDVGANVGDYAIDLRYAGYAGRIWSIEPVAAAYRRANDEARSDALWEVRNLALGPDDGSLEINVSANTVFSSALPLTERTLAADPAASYLRRESVSMTTLDAFIAAELAADALIAVKIDVQGFEMQVLEGAQATLDKLSYLELELSLVQVYEGVSLFPEMLAYLYSRGLELVLSENVFTEASSGRALQLNGIFVRP